eukprot:TRINITY_DN12200_c0_g1_i2.p1 TRINITY_DN12200_c0_g1~~TRINITY_DN12200_c0_g1_i2.p1  ORF type:complete len:439 (-),score=89.18 TRINITY_DN12200_c0_g1_i2:17-1309(-)
MEDVVKKVVEKNLLNDDQPSLELFDMDYFNGRVDSLLQAFPEDYFTHAMAVKANPLRCVMGLALARGLGAECASLQEAKHAIQIGFPASKVVYDSPVKTVKELKEAVDLGLHMNLDNEMEIDQVGAYLEEFKGDLPMIGLRINPVVGGGEIPMISTATKQSKFGLPLLQETQERIVNLFKKNWWLRGLHIHIGSQGVPVDKFVAGVEVLFKFIENLESQLPGQVKTVDIGGGLSTSYTENKEPDEFAYIKYREQLQQKIPVLFTGKYKIVTEFGRSLFLKAGTSLTKVQSVKEWVEGQNPIILTHLGTNQFPREVYLPHIWRHRFSLFTAEGIKKEGNETNVDIGGPLCFQGDYLAKEVLMSGPQAGDILAIHDTGAYTMSMYCRFNSILAGGVYGYTRNNGDLSLQCFKQRESYDECMAFWGYQNSVPL